MHPIFFIFKKLGIIKRIHDIKNAPLPYFLSVPVHDQYTIAIYGILLSTTDRAQIHYSFINKQCYNFVAVLF